jgi:hypothetical protein
LVILRFELKDVHLEAFYHLSHAPSPFSISFFFFFLALLPQASLMTVVLLLLPPH